MRIGQVEQLRRRRVVGRAERVHAHALEQLQALLDGAMIHGRAQGAEVVVVTGAVELHGGAVQREAAASR